MRYLNVFTKKEFTTTEGKTKRSWNQVGVVRISEKGRMYLQMHHLPNIEFYLFEPQTESPNEIVE